MARTTGDAAAENRPYDRTDSQPRTDRAPRRRGGRPGGAPPIERVFRALGDPTRRRVLERLSRSPASVSELAEPFDMALPSFVQHLKVLEECELVRSRKQGRVRTYRLAPDRLRLAEDWLTRRRRLWERRLDQLDAHLQTMKELDGAEDERDPEGREPTNLQTMKGLPPAGEAETRENLQTTEEEES